MVRYGVARGVVRYDVHVARGVVRYDVHVARGVVSSLALSGQIAR